MSVRMQLFFDTHHKCILQGYMYLSVLCQPFIMTAGVGDVSISLALLRTFIHVNKSLFEKQNCIPRIFCIHKTVDCQHISLTTCTFDSVQSAQRAKASLNGADIYSGCCTLKIEYAKVRAIRFCSCFTDGRYSKNNQVGLGFETILVI